MLSLLILSRIYDTELIVHSTYNLWTDERAEYIVDKAKASGINIISLLFKQDEDEPQEIEPDGNVIMERKSGAKLYPSKIITDTAVPADEIYSIGHLIEYAHKHGIKIKAWVPQFHDQMVYLKDNSYAMMYYDQKTVKQYIGDENKPSFFVSPVNPGVQNYEISILKEIVTDFDIDMVVLDWVRYDDYNMDFSQTSLDMWKKHDKTNQRNPKQFNFKNIHVSDKNHQFIIDWNSWRTDEIAKYIGKAAEEIKKIKPNIKVGAYVLDPEWEEVGQDIAKFNKFVDFVEPMCYYSFFKKTEDWIWKDNGIVDLCSKKMKDDSKIIPVFNFDYKPDVYQRIFNNLQKNFPKINTISFFYYSFLEDNHFNTIKSILDANNYKEETKEPESSSEENRSQTKTIIISVSITVVVIVIVAAIISVLCIHKKKKNIQDFEINV